MTLLDVQSITAYYGSSQVLFDVNLTIEPGEVVALMGRNGMGKSTTVKVICRMLDHKAGSVHFAGNDLASLPSHKAAQLGLGLVPEGRRCFSNLTVLENLVAASIPGRWAVKEVMDLFPQLDERRSQFAGSLSGGEQQMLAIGRALMTNPKLLVLDEATEGLAPVIRQEIWSAIHRLKNNSDMALLVIDKALSELRGVADRAVILERGETVWCGNFNEITSTIVDQYLGV